MRKLLTAAALPLAAVVLAAPLFAQTLSLDYSTFLGGTWYASTSSHDRGRAIAFDTAGDIYIVGDTNATDFPTLGPYQASQGGLYDVYTAKLTSTGSTLIFSTYLGGDAVDNGNDIAVAANRDVYVAGNTASDNFPTLNAFQASRGGAYSDVLPLDRPRDHA